MPFNPNYSEKSALSHLERQKCSNLTIADYCRKNNIRPTTFYGWKKRLNKRPGVNKTFGESSFVEVPIKTSSLHADSNIRVIRTEVEIPSAMIDHLGVAFSEMLVEQVFRK